MYRTSSEDAIAHDMVKYMCENSIAEDLKIAPVLKTQ